ncbi:MAG: hypothetical protein AAFX07_17190 [Pseudomonadota bacterium]
MKFGPIPTTIAVVFVLWLVVPDYEITVENYSVHPDTIFAFFIGGLAGGLRFAYLKQRNMNARETLSHALVAYIVATAIPLALFAGLVYFARELPAVAELLEQSFPATDVLNFLIGYFAIDAVPSLLALCAALLVSQSWSAQARA